ncbi:MAG: hypothetical protein JKX85_05935 [Phycisphaeraceae bacterium]|nr:hypothetical protein [Phycisphaeraceae bacterium]
MLNPSKSLWQLDSPKNGQGWSVQNNTDHVNYVHNGDTANVLFFDGHVQRHDQTSLATNWLEWRNPYD